MKTITKILLVLLLGVSLSQAAAFSKHAKYKDVDVQISSEQPLTVGTNTLKLHITKAGVAVVETVSLKAFMPAMPGMPAMQSQVKAKSLGNGYYEVKPSMSMSGTWQVHIFITSKTAKKFRVKSSLNF